MITALSVPSEADEFCGMETEAEVVWCQEEPMNMGGFSYVAPRLATVMRACNHGKSENIKYAGRAPSAATATGFGSIHTQEQKGLVQKALQSNPISEVS